VYRLLTAHIPTKLENTIGNEEESLDKIVSLFENNTKSKSKKKK